MKFEEVFVNEFRMIKDSQFKSHVFKILKLCPNYVMSIPSSSTGKYHPSDEVGHSRGMIYHIKRVAVFADEVACMEQHTNIERDIMIAGAILHDVFKNGLSNGKISKEGVNGTASKWTKKEHPIYIYELIHNYIQSIDNNDSGIVDGVSNLISLANVCLFHEGQWTIQASKDIYKSGSMTVEDKKLCNSMHMADYFASRRSVYDIMQDREDESEHFRTRKVV